jgi:hypothetical protein
MNDTRVPSRGRIGRPRRAFACSLALLALSGGFAEAQSTPPQADRSAIDPQASVDQKESAASSTQSPGVTEQLNTINQAIARLERPIAAPAEAWLALAAVPAAASVMTEAELVSKIAAWIKRQLAR